MADTIEAKLEAMGLTLPHAAPPAGSYVPTVRTGNLIFVAGQLPMGPDGPQYIGRCGEGMSLEDAQAAARLCALNVLAQVKAAVGDLAAVVRIVKLNGYVNSTAGFADHPKVINGASDLLVELLGEAGRHARAAVGVANLPFGAAVEIEAVVEVSP